MVFPLACAPSGPTLTRIVSPVVPIVDEHALPGVSRHEIPALDSKATNVRRRDRRFALGDRPRPRPARHSPLRSCRSCGAEKHIGHTVIVSGRRSVATDMRRHSACRPKARVSRKAPLSKLPCVPPDPTLTLLVAPVWRSWTEPSNLRWRPPARVRRARAEGDEASVGREAGKRLAVTLDATLSDARPLGAVGPGRAAAARTGPSARKPLAPAFGEMATGKDRRRAQAATHLGRHINLLLHCR